MILLEQHLIQISMIKHTSEWFTLHHSFKISTFVKHYVNSIFRNQTINRLYPVL